MSRQKTSHLAEQETSEKKPTTKIESVLALLKREHGATLAELIEATGWQPHTTRAALTGGGKLERESWRRNGHETS